MSKNRFLAFNDAIIAIIATIMVLAFKLPSHTGWEALQELAAPFFAYAASFFQILMVWYNHHQLYKNVREITIRTYIFNAFWLFAMSLFPFVTDWVGQAPMDRIAEYVLVIVLLIWMLLFNLMDVELTKANPEAEKALYSHSLSIKIRYGIPLLALLAIYFWPPAGLAANLILVFLVYLLFFRKSIY